MTRLAPGLLRDPVHFLALGFGAGLVPVAPGTAGTVVGVLIDPLLRPLGLELRVLVVVVMALAGIWICGASARRLGVHDHPAIVWDEIVGYLALMLLLPAGWIWALVGFGVFRLFDIWKPWPIRQLDHAVGGGLGIMLDDIAAAAWGALVLAAVLYLAGMY
ncbi:phosphatidylglycerophosphatase A [Thioalkalivibrio sp. XN279]|uniref:phosphatidylglycerophosphatase A family protein n=1 Tax=Thioalkalivibrio sp. XN279 TaxID=2714953 RepID=UPI00140760FB|nr:phosphatidylglycerophosphatase A [Thioalkalivibrio sp. XN279]